MADAFAAGTLEARVVAVVGNTGTPALRRARQRGIACAHLSASTHPDADELDAAMLNALQQAQTAVPVHAGESVEALAQRVQAVEREFLVRTLQNIACGNMRLTALATPPEPPCPLPHHRRKSQHP